jgi:hypothetical protein
LSAAASAHHLAPLRSGSTSSDVNWFTPCATRVVYE